MRGKRVYSRRFPDQDVAGTLMKALAPRPTAIKVGGLRDGLLGQGQEISSEPGGTHSPMTQLDLMSEDQDSMRFIDVTRKNAARERRGESITVVSDIDTVIRIRSGGRTYRSLLHYARKGVRS